MCTQVIVWKGARIYSVTRKQLNCPVSQCDFKESFCSEDVVGSPAKKHARLAKWMSKGISLWRSVGMVSQKGSLFARTRSQKAMTLAIADGRKGHVVENLSCSCGLGRRVSAGNWRHGKATQKVVKVAHALHRTIRGY